MVSVPLLRGALSIYQARSKACALRSCLLFDREPMFGRALIPLAGAEDGAGKLRLVGRVGIVLRLEAKAFVLLESAGSSAAVEKVATIELHTRLGGIDLHHAA